MSEDREQGLLEEFSLLGNWWLPDRPEKLIGGELNYNPKHGISLSLWGTFRESTENKNQYPIVLGRTDRGRPITLFQVKGDDDGFPPEGIVSEDFKVGYFIVDEHIPFMEKFHPQELIIRLYDFSEWMGNKLLEIETEHIGNGETKFTIKHKTQTLQSIDIQSLDCLISFWNGAKRAFSTANGMRINFHSTHHLVLQPKSPQNELGWYREAVQEVQNLFTLLAGNLMPPAELYLQLKVEHEDFVERHGKGYLTTVRLYYRPDLSKIRDPDFSFGFLYDYEALKNCLSEVFNRYAERKDDFRNSISLFLLYLSSVSTQVELQFLVLFQALEAFCRYKKDEIEGYYVEKGAFEALCSEFLVKVENEVSKEFADKVKSALQNQNSKSRTTREQLKYVVNSLPEKLKKLFHETPDAFIQEIVDTRDFLTHGRAQSRRKKKVLHLLDLYIATLRLWLLLTALISLELKIEEDTVVRAIEGSPNYRRLKENEKHKEQRVKTVEPAV